MKKGSKKYIALLAIASTLTFYYYNRTLLNTHSTPEKPTTGTTNRNQPQNTKSDFEAVIQQNPQNETTNESKVIANEPKKYFTLANPSKYIAIKPGVSYSTDIVEFLKKDPSLRLTKEQIYKIQDAYNTWMRSTIEHEAVIADVIETPDRDSSWLKIPPYAEFARSQEASFYQSISAITDSRISENIRALYGKQISQDKIEYSEYSQIINFKYSAASDLLEITRTSQDKDGHSSKRTDVLTVDKLDIYIPFEALIPQAALAGRKSK